MKTPKRSVLSFLKKNWLLILIAVLVIWVVVKDNGPIQLTKNADFDTGGYYEEEYYGGIAAAPEFESRVASQSFIATDGIILDDFESGGDYDQKVIKTGSLSLHVDDVQETIDSITTRVNEWNGFVLNSNLDKGSDSYYGYMSVKVPAENFDTAMEGLKELALIVNSESSNAQDVTEAYADLQARLNNLQAEEQSYLALLDGRGSLEEVLNVTQALSNVRYKIESTQGQINYYDARTDFSTITISLTEDSNISAVTETWRPISTVRDSFSEWVVFLQDATDWLINLAIFGWPILLLLIIIWLVRKRRK